uniref:RNA_ligase domain-containing protein n=1 Tax=Steinernema glaseri TaxID=37863 RepID=A0A1I7Y6R2_9BILA
MVANWNKAPRIRGPLTIVEKPMVGCRGGYDGHLRHGLRIIAWDREVWTKESYMIGPPYKETTVRAAERLVMSNGFFHDVFLSNIVCATAVHDICA